MIKNNRPSPGLPQWTRVTGSGSVLLILLVAQTLPAQPQDRMEAQREFMVKKYLEAEGISNRRVLQSMRSVPRHEFVRTVDRAKAYYDAALPIGYKQTISPPFIVAYMTETIDPQPEDKVLEIGTGSGYQAAVLSGLAKDVYTIEIVEELGRQAAKRLNDLGYENVHAKIGDGYQGWPEHAPFDKIIVTCSPEKVPLPLVQQLKENGKMIIPLGERYQQVFYLFEKQDGKLVQKALIPTLFVPMTGISEENRQVLPDPLHPKIVNGGFEKDENEDGLADNWHYQRLTELVTEDQREGKTALKFSNDEPGRVAQMLQGMAIDGRSIDALEVSLWARYDQTVPGTSRLQRPTLTVHFYDSIRRPIGESTIGPWIGTLGWQKYSTKIKVPPAAREAIVRIGLHGATGDLIVDDVQMQPIK